MALRVKVDRPHFSWMTWGMLNACPRRYFLNAYAFQFPGDFGYDIQSQKKLTFWQAWAGQLADDGISEAIRCFKKTGVWRQDMDEWLRDRARLWVKDSRDWQKAAQERKPLPEVSTQPLDAYFFGPVPDKADHLEILDRARTAMRNWFATDIPARIAAAPKSAVLIREAGEFPVATHGQVPIYSSYDFALRTPTGVTIFDWKTGNFSPDKERVAIEQLHWYALYAIEVWKVEPENVRLAPVFLSANCGYEEATPDINRLEEIKREWASKHRELKDMMLENPALESLEERFPMTENLRECAGCMFRSCPGYSRIDV